MANKGERIDIAKERKKTMLTQEEVARELRIASCTYRRWEKQNRIPRKRDRVQFMELIKRAKI